MKWGWREEAKGEERFLFGVFGSPTTFALLFVCVVSWSSSNKKVAR